MKKESLELDIVVSTKRLLELAGKKTWNTISDKCEYILSEIKNTGIHSVNQNMEEHQEKAYKNPVDLPIAITELERLYENLYDVNLYIYLAMKDKTIIEVQYYLKTSLDPVFRARVINNEPMLHCKLPLPPYLTDKSEKKFDIHWQLSTIHHKWNMFWWKNLK